MPRTVFSSTLGSSFSSLRMLFTNTSRLREQKVFILHSPNLIQYGFAPDDIVLVFHEQLQYLAPSQ